MKNYKINTSQNVKNLLVFTHDMEIFMGLGLEKKTNPSNISRTTDNNYVELSKGALQKKNPLPIINALSKELFTVINKSPELLEPESLPDMNILPIIIENAFESLGISYKTNFFWFQKGIRNPVNISNIPENVQIDLTAELLCLVNYILNKAPGNRIINPDFVKVKQNYLHYYERKHLLTKDIAHEAFQFRKDNGKMIATSLLIFPPSVNPETVNIYSKGIPEKQKKPTSPMDKWQVYEIAREEDALCVSTDNPLGYAWYELYFANIFNAKFSICTYCGRTYSLEGKKGNAINKATCGKQSCKKLHKQVYEQSKRISDPEETREKQTKRKRLSIAYKEYKENDTFNIELYARRYNLDSLELREYFNKKKVKETINISNS